MQGRIQQDADTGPYAARGLQWGLFWAAVAAIAGWATARLDPNVLEEGIIVHTAERLLGGERLYRDVVVHTAPLAYELLHAAFGLLGAHLWVARALLVAAQVLATGAVFALVRRAGPPAAAHAAAAVVASAPVFLFPQLSNYYYTTLALYGSLLVAAAATRSIESSRWAVVTGAGIAMVALCKQTSGVALAVALVPVCVALAPSGRRLSQALSILAGGTAITVSTLGVYALRGDLDAFVFGMVELPLSMGATFRAPALNLWPPGELDPTVRENWVMYLPSLYYLAQGLFVVIGRSIIVLTQLLYALPFAVLLASGFVAWRGRLTPAGWIHAAVLVAMAANLFPRSSWGHLVVALPPAVVQALLLLPRSASAQESPRLARGLAIGAAAITLGSAATAAWIGSQAGAATFGPRVPVAPVSRSYRQPSIPRVIHYLRRNTRPGEAIFVARQEPLIYFATGTRNPTPFGGVLPGLPDLQEPAILSALEEVRFVVMSDIDQPLYTYYSDELPGVQVYLERHYQIPGDFPLDDYSWISVARRGRDRGATAIDFVEQRHRGRVYSIDDTGQENPGFHVPQRLATRLLHRPLAVALGSGGGGIDFEVDVPDDAVFQAGIGYRGLVSIDHHYLHPPGVTLVVAIRRDPADAFEDLATFKINDDLRAGRTWRPVEIDLSTYAGAHVTLRLEARARDLDEPDMLTWWGSPRIALRAGVGDR